MKIKHYIIDEQGRATVHEEDNPFEDQAKGQGSATGATVTGKILAMLAAVMKRFRRTTDSAEKITAYILDRGGEPFPEPNIERFKQWFEREENRLIKRSDLNDGFSVSTMFLGFDHRVSGNGPPVLWETVVLGSLRRNLPRATYTSKAAALKGHDAAVALIEESRKGRGL